MGFALLTGVGFEFGTCLQRLRGLSFGNVLGWWEGILFAAPKQKVTHARKRKRMATQYLRPLMNIEGCKTCGSIKLMNTLCWTCYKRYRAEKKIAE